jgi:hypothetical protein
MTHSMAVIKYLRGLSPATTDAFTQAADALHALSDRLNDEGVVEAGWCIRGMADALDGQTDSYIDNDHEYASDYWDGVRSAQSLFG